MKSILVYIFIIVIYSFNDLIAQEQLFNSFNGTSARAAGMGQAYTALVDDPTAIYWNPAAMSIIKNGYAGLMLRRGSKSFSSNTDNSPYIKNWEVSARPVTDLGFLGIVFPFHAGIANTTLGVGVRRSVAFPQEQTEEIINNHDENYKLNYNHDGELSVFTVAISLSLSEKLSLGGTFNFYTGEEVLSLKSSNQGAGEEVLYNITQEYSRTSFDMGVRYQYQHNWIFGLKINFPFTLAIKQTIGLTNPVVRSELISFPLYFNLAAAYLINEDIKITADYFYRPWQLVKMNSLESEYQLTEHSLHSLHLGGEYLMAIFEMPLALRLGYYAVPTLFTNSSNVQRVNHALTAGVGYPGNWIIINFGLEWIPATYKTDALSNSVSNIPSDISIETRTIQISFDLFLRIT